ncbi:2-oxo acid dehydrogenase subunit E2 [Acinetobacter pollinis]|uniref:2-oxo acid dehydrogenase subunit E2 n=1 Tax=Acinetobacter pollinis TaxID=2605270 RepID=UPI0018A2EE65|nr:2-oxo acid dehydrogenase subunit E2 [Acinetobacter pollinis]MBF7690620.1 2-oxo acid dehydrogenase subunit E2 [Acinetobacter pollinis]MBF7693365.1 2-oxo acid dehydrogenase subunit E2 [Acinetobacter pollinis]MBF7698155.1 2-oxo acid dehydrogenase subunit E2 [Acinetobacter pollinis]MBF7701186.1 2-oxo acid dehydrogenase subunit E2 [Acinetobacter pollinis]
MEIKTPDIGVDKATVGEILVQVGDTIAENDSIIVVESDKATVEVPSTSAGVVTKILVKEGDEIGEGVPLLEISSSEQQSAAPSEPKKEEKVEPSATQVSTQEKVETAPVQTSTSSQVVDIQVPDIGVEKATVGEILVKVGDTIEENDSIVVVESDKATVEVPCTSAGVVESIEIKEGDLIQEGVVLIKLKTTTTSKDAAPVTSAPQQVEKSAEPTVQVQEEPSTQALGGSVEMTVPDLGVDQAAIAEILVKVGDTIEKDDSIIVVESDKATVEVPSTESGVVTALHVEVGQTVKQGVKLATIEVKGSSKASQVNAPVAPQATAPKASSAPQQVVEKTSSVEAHSSTEKLTKQQQADNAKVYAGPAVRKLARELGVVLAEVKASGPHARLMKEDVFAFVKQRLTEKPKTAEATTTAPAAGLPKLPDFTAFGGVEEKPMTRLQQVSVPQLSLNNFIPQVTQFDHADITDLEAWRGELKGGFKQQGISLTILAFIAKAVAHLLKEEPYFAAHLADDQKSVLLRNEIHMGIAVATPDGLTVPVIRNPDQKSIKDIAIELGELSKKAREKKLSPKDLQGANFTITSLGSIGGTAFTPLVNWPQVAILGISPATIQPVWNGKDFDPRLMLPLSLSYDHRVINGADAARFTNKLTKLLNDIRSLLL